MTEIVLKRGDYAPYQVQLLILGLPFDLTGGALAFTVKTAYGGAIDDSDAIFQPLHHWIDGGSSYGVEMIAKATSFIRIFFLPEDTKSLPGNGPWVYDLQVETAPYRTYTVDEGTVRILPDITQRELIVP